MARIKKFSPQQKLSSFQTFIVDDNPNSDYFRITEFKDTFTGGKNGFLIEGSEYLKESTEIKIELLDVEGEPLYFEPGNGVPEYYEGISKLIAIYIYEDTPIGLGKITILGELKEYDDNGVKREVPEQWKGAYNVKWEKTFQINKNLANEDKVRFYRRPKVAIDEIVKPIFSKTPNTINQTGTINGTPLVPNAGSKLSSFSLPTSYRITTNDDSYWTGSVVGQILNVSSLNYSSTITDVVSKTELVVDPPYAPNNVVSSFSGETYSVDFVHLEGVIDLATALTGSFAKIKITDMKTFVGDAARIKVFRRSQSQLSDYEFVQDIQLESTELLRDIETVAVNEEYYGNFTNVNLESYWVTSSNDITLEFNQNFLYNSAKLSSTNTENFFTTQSFGISPGVEYNLSFNIRKESNTSTNDYIKAFLSGSYNGTEKSQVITTINSSNSVLQKTNVSENIIADNIQTASLYFEVVGNNWYINNVSLKAAQETAFSPDEITFIQQVPKTLPSETFDYRFEFYDINNNYIPVLVEKTKTFDGGNLNLFEKSIELVPDQLYFAFDSASNPLPPTIINFDVVTTLVTGSVNYTSQSFDFFGNELSASEFAGGQYPGLLRDIRTDNPFLTVSDFTGSRDDLTVQYVRYTAEVEGVTDTVIITRVQDGAGGVNFEIRPYRGTVIKNKSDKDLEIQAIRIDGINEIVLKENLPQAGFSDAKLRVLSSSLDPITLQPSGSYILLSEASSSKFIRGLNAGTTGSGEINYNATFNRDAITNELVVFLMDGEDSGSILTSIILTDSLDGLGSGFVQFSAEQFSLQPRLDTEYNPITASVTASFQDRFSPLAESFISGCLMITPSASIDVDFVTHYYMFYETGTFDRRVSVRATNLLGNPVYSGFPGQSVNFYSAEETKQLNFNFTYVEDITSASVSVDKTFYIVPEGKPGDDAIVIDVEPRIVQLSANQRGAVYDYGPLDTDISIKQGRLDLVYDNTQQAGTFRVINVTPTNIFAGSLKPFGDISASFEGYSSMPNPILSASITYNLEIHPYFTSSYFTQSVIQKITKAIDGAGPIDLFVNPIAVNFTGDEDGNIADYAAGNTTLIVKQGDEFLTFDPTNVGTPGTFTCSIDQTGIQVGIISASARFVPEYGDDTLHFLNYDQMPYTTASVDYNVTIYPFSLSNGIASGSVELTRTQIFSKAVAGKRARTVKLDASTRQVVYDGDDIVVAPEGSVILSVGATGFTGSAYYQFFKDGFAYSLIDDTPEYEISSGDSVGPGQVATWKVEARDGSPDAGVIATDQLTISGVKNGGDGYTVELSNPSPVVAVQVDGTVDLSNTGTVIRAFKSNTELTHVSEYSSPSLDINGDPIGTIGEFSASLESLSVFLTQPNIPQGNPATVGSITAWTNAISNTSAEVVYKVDIEGGRAVFFKTQSLSVSLEGAVGPGIVFRGEYSNLIDYIYSVENGRRDAVLYDKDGDNYPETYYIAKQNNGPGSTVVAPEDDPTSADYWEEMGTEDLFVAAKIAIFEESFVKNTINIGQPSTAYNVNPQITIYGGDSEPYISIGQGTQGYGFQGIFMGVTEDGGPNATAGTSGLMSIQDDTGDSYLRWDGYNLEVKSNNVLIETNNLTIDSQNELISIGATGYDTNGIWLGRDGGASKLSLKNGTTSYLKWDGSELEIKSDNALIETTNLTIDSSNELISIGQGTNGYVQTGVFVGMDGGNAKLSLKSTPAGGTYNSLEWDGSTLTIRGAVRQTAAGVVEGSLRGAWSSGVEYYPNDIVSANGQSWVMIGVVHTSNANDEPAVGVNYTTYWSVAAAAGSSGTAGSGGTSGANGTSGINGTSGTNGAPGGSGAGIVYRGRWEEGETYYKTTTRTDVVKGADTEYYLAKSTHTAAAGQDPTGGAGITGTPATYWESFGATFTSVATDILFADQVYADQTINIGSDGSSTVIALNADSANSNANPRIQIGQNIDAGEGFLDDGIYFGFAGGNPVLSMVSGSTFFYYQSGSIELSDASFVGSGSIIEGSSIRVGRNLDVSPTASNAYNFTVSSEGVVSASQAYIAGTIAASDGTIGNWVIDPIVNGAGGTLRDADSEIVFEPNIPEIQIYSESVQRVFIGSSELTSIAAVNDTFTWSGGEPIITSTTITSNASNRTFVSTNRYTGVSSTVSVTPGTYQFTDVDWPTLTIVEPNAVSAGTQSYPNYSPSYDGQYHGGLTVLQQYPVYVYATLYLEVVDTNAGNAVIGSTALGNAIASGDFGFANGYVAIGDGPMLSVTGDTEITLSDGSIKFAKDISITDTILAWDEVHNKFSESTITNVKSREVDRIFKVTVGGLSVKVSENHGFWTDGGDEIKVQDIIVGETHIYIKDNDTIKYVVVDDIEEIVESTKVYTFSVPPLINYISNNIISHNAVGSLVWSEINLDLDNVGASATISGASGQTKNITISSTTTAAAVRFRLVISTQSGVSKSVNSSGTITDSWVQQTVDIDQTNTGGKEVYFASSPIDSDGISIVKSNNFVELKPAGIQIVTSENIYVKARRKDSLVNTTAADAELFRVEGGTSYFTAASAPFDTSISVAGHIRPYEAGWDLGGSTSLLKFKNLNGFDIEDLAVSKGNSGYTRLFDNIIIQWVRTTGTTQFSGTWPTAFTTIYGATVNKGNASSTYQTDNNGVNVSYTTTNYYVDTNEGTSRTVFIIAIGEKT
jgi:hypothetical protein